MAYKAGSTHAVLDGIAPGPAGFTAIVAGRVPTPTVGTGAANKSYVDAVVSAAGGGGAPVAITGTLTTPVITYTASGLYLVYGTQVTAYFDVVSSGAGVVGGTGAHVFTLQVPAAQLPGMPSNGYNVTVTGQLLATYTDNSSSPVYLLGQMGTYWDTGVTSLRAVGQLLWTGTSATGVYGSVSTAPTPSASAYAYTLSGRIVMQYTISS